MDGSINVGDLRVYEEEFCYKSKKLILENDKRFGENECKIKYKL